MFENIEVHESSKEVSIPAIESLVFSKQQINAASCVEEKSRVHYFLLARSIELALKGFLLHNGFSSNKLKSIGHDLSKLLAEAKKNKIYNYIPSFKHEGYEKVIGEISPPYNKTHLAYPDPYFLLFELKKLPDINALGAAAQTLLDYVHPLVIGAVD